MSRTLIPDILVQYYFKKCGIEIKPLSYFKQNPIIVIKNDETPIVIKAINELPLKKNNLEVHEVDIAKDIDIDDDITVITDSTTQETVDSFMKELEKEKEDEVELVDAEEEYDEELEIGSDDEDESSEESEEDDEEETSDSYENKIQKAVENYAYLIYSYIDNHEPHKLFGNKINRQQFYEALKKVCLETTEHFMFGYGLPNKEKGIKFNSFEPDPEHFAKMQEIVLKINETNEENQKKQFEKIFAEKKLIKGLFKYESLGHQYFYLWDQYGKKYLSPFRYNKLGAFNKDKLSKYVQALIL